MQDRFRLAVMLFVFNVLIFVVGCPMSPDDMGLPGNENDNAGLQGPKGDPGEQGPPGASPFELIGNDAVYTQGNVGIGTDAPTEALEVTGNAKVNGTVFADAFSSDSPLALQTAGTTRIYVDDATGHVGIGTTSPTESLHVEGAAWFANAVLTPAVGSENAPLELQIDGVTKLFVADSSMTRIGVGADMTNPASELDVRGGIRTTTFSGNSRNALEMRASGSAASMTYSQSVGNSTTSSTKISFTLDTTHILGDTGLGRTPTTNRLEVEGGASKTTAGDWLANSDARIKTDVQTITGALDALNRVRLVRFRYTDQYRAAHPGIGDHTYINVIAQEFREVFPEFVQGSGERLPDGSEILQVDTYPLTIYAAAAAQELHQLIRDREARIRELHARNATQASRIDRLEARLAALERRLSGEAAASTKVDPAGVHD